jgi:hypothetical protein
VVIGVGVSDGIGDGAGCAAARSDPAPKMTTAVRTIPANQRFIYSSSKSVVKGLYHRRGAATHRSHIYVKMSLILDIKTCVHYIVAMESLTNPTRRASRRYAAQLSITLAVYLVLLVGGLYAVQHLNVAGNLRYVLLLLPLAPVLAIVPAVLRYLHDTDEFDRRLTMESLSVAAGVTAVYSITCGFLEVAGMQPVSAWFTWLVVMGTWGIVRIVLRLRYR